MNARDMPAAGIDVTVDLVRALLTDQHPDLAALELAPLAHGWDNAVWRLGDRYTLRLPRRSEAAGLVEHEQRWLPVLAPRLPLPIPAPARVGRPGSGYPWSWSVNPWLDGTIAPAATLAEPVREARRLGGFLAELHVPAPDDAPINPHRGRFIGEHAPLFVERVERIRTGLDAVVDGGAMRVLDRWHELVDVPPHAGPPTWIHGDLHAANVLVHRGELAAVIDFGDLCAGDPATDLGIAWMLFDEAGRAAMRSALRTGPYPPDAATWRRGEAWALRFAVFFLAESADNAVMRGIGERLASALFERA